MRGAHHLAPADKTPLPSLVAAGRSLTYDVHFTGEEETAGLKRNCGKAHARGVAAARASGLRRSP